MRPLQTLIGLPVVDLQSGDEVGQVSDVYMDQAWAVQGFLVDVHSIFKKNKWLPLNSVVSVGEDGIMVDVHVQWGDPPILSIPFLSGKERLYGKEVMTEAGDELGRIEDVYYREDLGKLVACELSEGWISDIKKGRVVIDWPEVAAIGESKLIIAGKQTGQEK